MLKYECNNLLRHEFLNNERERERERERNRERRNISACDKRLMCEKIRNKSTKVESDDLHKSVEFRTSERPAFLFPTVRRKDRKNAFLVQYYFKF